MCVFSIRIIKNNNQHLDSQNRWKSKAAGVWVFGLPAVQAVIEFK